MMRKIFSWLVRLVLSAAVLFTLLLTITSPITVRVDTPGLVKSTLDRVVEQTGDSNIKLALQIARTLGIQDAVISRLPKRLTAKTTYKRFYDLTNNYRKNGKLKPKDLGFANKTKRDKFINTLVLGGINAKLKDNRASLKKAISYYEKLFIGLIALYLLSVLLILFNTRLAIIPLLLAGIGTYYFTGTFIVKLQEILRADIYPGFWVEMGSSFSISLILAVFISFIWLFAARLGKKKKKKQEALTAPSPSK